MGSEVGEQSLATPFYPAQNSPAVTSCLFLKVLKRYIGSVEIPEKGKKISVKRIKFLAGKIKQCCESGPRFSNLSTRCTRYVKPWKERFTCSGILFYFFPLHIRASSFLHIYSQMHVPGWDLPGHRGGLEGGKHMLWNHKCWVILQPRSLPTMRPGVKCFNVSLPVKWGSW